MSSQIEIANASLGGSLEAERRDFYVYVYFRPDGSPCYVGKGCKHRYRHYGRGDRSNRALAAIRYKAGGALPVVVVRTGMSESEALSTEVAFIKAIGRRAHGGPLVNFTDGGEGTSGFSRPKSAEHRAKIAAANSGRSLSKETREKISLAKRGRPRSAEAVEASASKIRGRKRGAPSEETRARIAAANTGKSPSTDTRSKMSAAHKGKPRDRVAVEKTAAAHRGRKRSDATRAAISEAARRGSAQRSAAARVYFASLTVEQKTARAAKISAATKSAMADPSVKSRLVAGIRQSRGR